MEDRDRAALSAAVIQLEYPSFAMKLANAVGTPVERMLDSLPTKGRDIVHRAAQRAIERCFDAALATLGASTGDSLDAFHKAACAVSGVIGGAAGFYALPIELPVSTGIMLRSIAEIARSEGEDLSDAEARLSCVMVFAFGARRRSDDYTDVGYYAVRMALAQGVREAAAAIGAKGLAWREAPAIVRAIAQIAERFGVTVSEKAAAQAAPILGAVGGAAINSAFIDHYQKVAHGHFTVRRLERKYGQETVRAEYERTRAAQAG